MLRVIRLTRVVRVLKASKTMRGLTLTLTLTLALTLTLTLSPNPRPSPSPNPNPNPSHSPNQAMAAGSEDASGMGNYEQLGTYAVEEEHATIRDDAAANVAARGAVTVYPYP